MDRKHASWSLGDGVEAFSQEVEVGKGGVSEVENQRL